MENDNNLKIYVPDNKGNFKLFEKNEWIKEFNKEGMIKYLRDDIVKSLKGEFLIPFKAFLKNKEFGYFSLIRIITPHFSFFGRLYKGIIGNKKGEETEAVQDFMKDYLGRINKDAENYYNEFAGYIWHCFRHGLTHTNLPKIYFNPNGQIKEIGWNIKIEIDNPMNRYCTLGHKFSLFPKILFDDLLKAIDFYIEDIENSKNSEILQENFKKSLCDMNKLNHIDNIKNEEVKKVIKLISCEGLTNYKKIMREIFERNKNFKNS
jgi:hypothetical protein